MLYFKDSCKFLSLSRLNSLHFFFAHALMTAFLDCLLLFFPVLGDPLFHLLDLSEGPLTCRLVYFETCGVFEDARQVVRLIDDNDIV